MGAVHGRNSYSRCLGFQINLMKLLGILISLTQRTAPFEKKNKKKHNKQRHQKGLNKGWDLGALFSVRLKRDLSVSIGEDSAPFVKKNKKKKHNKQRHQKEEKISHDKARIQSFLKKTKAKLRKKRERMDGKCDEAEEELKKLEKQAVKMWKGGEYQSLRAMIKGRDWGFPMNEKVGRRALQLLTEAAYVQPPPQPAFALDIKSLRYPYNNVVKFDGLLAH